MTTQPSTINANQLRVIWSRATDQCILGPDENMHSAERSRDTVPQGLLIGNLHLEKPNIHRTTKRNIEDECWQIGWTTTVHLLFFFSLHCRTSARHGRSTTGILSRIEIKFPWKRTKHKPNKTKTHTNPHTQAKARARQNSQGNLQLSETKWNIRAPLSPSNVLVHRVVLLHVVQ